MAEEKVSCIDLKELQNSVEYLGFTAGLGRLGTRVENFTAPSYVGYRNKTSAP